MFSNLVEAPSTFSALPPHIFFLKASPKAISRRTSYLRVRLEFLRYPHLIRCLFNDNQFGPPLDFTLASSWTWIGHSVSGLLYMTYSHYSYSLSLRLRTLFVLYLAIYNNSLDRSTKSTISHLNVLYLLVNIGFQVLFHSPPGVLFTVPSRYLFSIGHQVVFSLTEWSPLFHTRFPVSRTTLDLSLLLLVFIYRTFTFFGLPSLVILLTLILDLLIIRTPVVLLHLVWAPPGSLATTSGIVFTFFSYGY